MHVGAMRRRLRRDGRYGVVSDGIAGPLERPAHMQYPDALLSTNLGDLP